MKTVKVKFESMEECQRYLSAIENCAFNIDLQCGRRVIDGKSMLGVLGFGLRRVLELRLHTEEEEAVEALLNRIDFCLCADEMKLAV